jgi:hypothetical protein
MLRVCRLDRGLAVNHWGVGAAVTAIVLVSFLLLVVGAAYLLGGYGPCKDGFVGANATGERTYKGDHIECYRGQVVEVK